MSENDSGLFSGEKVRGAFTEDHGIGTRRGGEIIEPFPYQRQKNDYDTGEPMTWDDGNPRMQFVITVQTDLNEGPDDEGVDDNGKRRFYADKPSDLLKVTQAAVRKAQGKDFEIGAQFFVTRSGKGEAQKTAGGGKRKPPWLHSVEYTRPAPGHGKTSGVLSDGGGKPTADDEPPF